jgi:hypothetical protein
VYTVLEQGGKDAVNSDLIQKVEVHKDYDV